MGPTAEQEMWKQIKDEKTALLVTVRKDGSFNSRLLGCARKDFDGTLWFLALKTHQRRLKLKEINLLSSPTPDRQTVNSYRSAGARELSRILFRYTRFGASHCETGFQTVQNLQALDCLRLMWRWQSFGPSPHHLHTITCILGKPRPQGRAALRISPGAWKLLCPKRTFGGANGMSAKCQ